jgi:single-stranded-DNA-specific exonuclease
LKITENSLERFRAEFCQYAAATLGEEDRQQELRIDAEVPLSAFTLQSVEQMERLSPFGQGNARPLLCTTDVTLAEPPRAIGAGQRHLAMKLTQCGVAMRAVAFGGGERREELAEANGPWDIAFRPVINRFRGRASVELQLVDWRKSGG